MIIKRAVVSSPESTAEYKTFGKDSNISTSHSGKSWEPQILARLGTIPSGTFVPLVFITW
jgi:hypothetical protein